MERVCCFHNFSQTVTVRFISQKEGFDDINVSLKEKGVGHGDFDFEMTELDENVFVRNGQILVKCIVIIDGLPGPQLSNIDLLQTSNHSDVVLVVQGKRMNFNKSQLAKYSKVFEKMFFSNFKEATQNEIQLKDVEWYQFYNFLQCLNPGPDIIDDGNVEYLLKLADRFDIPQMLHDCERYLVRTVCVPKPEKLIYADRYALFELMTNVVPSLTGLEIGVIMKNASYAEFKHVTKDALLIRALELIK